MLFVKPEQNQSIWVPKHNLILTPTMTLVLKHTLSSTKYELTDLVNSGNNSGYYIFIGLDLSNLESGEYEYQLLDADGWQKEVGLLQVMSVLKDPISYNKSNQTIVYNGK